MNPLTLRPYTQNDLPALCAIWNEVVAAGDAFPQEDCLTPETGAASAAQTAAPAQAGGASSTVEELKQYKALLDAGVLTEEEFAAKKRQLLGI